MTDEKDLDLANGTILIRYGKERKTRDKTILLLEDELQILRNMPRGFPDMPLFRHEGGIQGCKPGQRFGKRYFSKCWDRACEKLGIQGVPLYPGTKHTTATAVSNVAGKEAAKSLAKISTNKAMERYINPSKTSELEILSIRGDLLKEAGYGTPVVHTNKAGKSAK